MYVDAQFPSCVQLFATPWTAACQASLSFTNSQNLLKLMFIESGMPSHHLTLCRPPSPAFSLPQHQGLFQSVSSLHHCDLVNPVPSACSQKYPCSPLYCDELLLKLLAPGSSLLCINMQSRLAGPRLLNSNEGACPVSSWLSWRAQPWMWAQPCRQRLSSNTRPLSQPWTPHRPVSSEDDLTLFPGETAAG